jgi:nitrogen fixation NifU-like protein
MSLLENLYREIVLDHYRHPRHYGPLEGAERFPGQNPSCGDHLVLYLDRQGDGPLRLAFEAEGCAISQASASLMADLLTGTSADRAAELARAFIATLHGGSVPEELGDLAAFSTLAQLPARIPCALLPWTTLLSALSPDRPAADPAAP